MDYKLGKCNRLNLGCGNDYREGWDNADLYAKKADLRFDFEKAPYPIKDNTYDHIHCSQVLEHLRCQCGQAFLYGRLSSPVC